MLQLRRSNARGHAEHGWLESRHTFSFANYHDPEHMGFGPLRVINEDRVQPGMGFGTHPHRDMEIISYVLEGTLEHKDSMGNGSVIRPGDVQHMSAGTGVTHSEFNGSKVEGLHFLQIWIQPSQRGGEPRYGQQHFSRAQRLDQLRVVASGDGREDSIRIRQDALMFAGVLTDGTTVEHAVQPGRRAWVHLAHGSVTVDGHALQAGDALGTDDASTLHLTANGEAEVLVFDLP
ncbi:MAG: pirin family protein [Nannocystales bacterium]